MANRQSARKVERRTNKRLMMDMQNSVERLTAENAALTKKNRSLRTELASLLDLQQQQSDGGLTRRANINAGTLSHSSSRMMDESTTNVNPMASAAFESGDILPLILKFVPHVSFSWVATNVNPMASAFERNGDILPLVLKFVPSFSWVASKLSFSWVASLRLVSKQWKRVIDDPANSFIWFDAAQALGLDPPMVLYAGGNHREVAALLLADQRKRQSDQEEALTFQVRRSEWRTACRGLRSPQVKPQHPKPTRPIELSKETCRKIVINALGLEDFLKAIIMTVVQAEASRQGKGSLRGSWSSNEDSNEEWHAVALTRYQMFLYLKQKHPNVWMIPTADIEFCWLSHIFRTEVYWKDMAAMGLSGEHTFALSGGQSGLFLAAAQATKTLWETTFGVPYYDPHLLREKEEARNDMLRRTPPRQPTFAACHERLQRYAFLPVMGPISTPHSSRPTLPKETTTYSISLTADEVKADLCWFPELQRALDDIRRNQYDVMCGRGHNMSLQPLFETHLVPSYERFLNLCHTTDNAGAMAPPYALDLIWHAHQADTVTYKEDCLALFGRELWHHPWPNGLGVSSELSSDFECAWKEAYGSTIEEDWRLALPGERAWGWRY